MTTGISTFGMQGFRSIVKQILKLWTCHSGLHSDGLISLIKPNHFIHVFAHVQTDATLNSFHAPGNR